MLHTNDENTNLPQGHLDNLPKSIIWYVFVFWERFDFIGAKVHGNKPIGMCYETASSLIKMQ